jgi:hypothetical protein
MILKQQQMVKMAAWCLAGGLAVEHPLLAGQPAAQEQPPAAQWPPVVAAIACQEQSATAGPQLHKQCIG